MKNNTYSYSMITNLSEIPDKENLIKMYNGAVETIWHLENTILRLKQENELLWKSYEELSDKLFG